MRWKPFPWGRRSYIQTLTDLHVGLDAALTRLEMEETEAVLHSKLDEATKAETIALIQIGFGKLRALALDWKNRAERFAQLEQPSREEAARRAVNNLGEWASPAARVRKAWAAAWRELKA